MSKFKFSKGDHVFSLGKICIVIEIECNKSLGNIYYLRECNKDEKFWVEEEDVELAEDRRI